jgi:hypothetical protein
VIDREALRDIPLGYLISLLKGEAHSQEHPVGGALDPGRAPVEDVGIDHRGADVLRGSDINPPLAMSANC